MTATLTPEQVARRCELIDKKYDAGLTTQEEAELLGLQTELANYQRQIAPRPLAVLELIEEGLMRRANISREA